MLIMGPFGSGSKLKLHVSLTPSSVSRVATVRPSAIVITGRAADNAIVPDRHALLHAERSIVL